MLRCVRRALLLLIAASCSCSSSSEPDGPPVAFSLTSRPILPFPTDAIMAADPSRPTGLRINLVEAGKNLGDVDEALFLFGDDFAHALDEIDGWSTLGPVFSPLTEDADPASLEDHVLLIDVPNAEIIPTGKRAFGGITQFKQETHWVSARPPFPLRAGTRHAIVLLRGLRSKSGVEMARSPVFAALFDGGEPEGDPARIAAARARIEGLAEAFAALGIDAKNVLSADTFTTQSIQEETDVLLAAYRAEPDPTISAPAVFASPLEDPRWEGPRDQAIDHIRAVARITVQVPNYREDVKGRLIVSASGATRQSYENVEALIVLPDRTGPSPIVVYQHGVGDDKESVWHFANDLCAQGVAIIAFDAPLHGFRTDRPGTAATEFINIVEPALVADNFRQAQTEPAFLVRAIDAFAALDLLGDGGPELDASRLLWIGNSLGSIIGGAAIGLEPRYEGAALMVGGGTLLEFFDRVLGGFALQQFPAELFVTVAQAALDRGDPSNYAHLSANKQVLLLQAMQDEVMPPGATRALARSMRLPQIEPIFERDDRLPSMPAPVTGRGWTQFSPATHSLAYSPGNTPEAYAASRAQLFHFVETWAATGTGEISSEP